MEEVIIYGGAFNPPTRAHQLILEACVARAEENDGQVWVMPSGDRFDKIIDRDRVERLRLVEALIESVPAASSSIVHLNTSDIDTSSPTQTYETYERLTGVYPEYDFKWVFGADSVATMKMWGRGVWLRKSLGMLLVPRPGVVLESMPPNAELLDIETGLISSSEVRWRIEQGLDIGECVPVEVQRVLESKV